jgi:DNA-binding LytR/AlgR family response regulator
LRITVVENPQISETNIQITVPKKSEEVEKLENMIRTYYIQIMGKKDNENYLLKLEDIFYFEAVENRVFAYVEKDVYEVNYKLLELCELLRFTSFIQTTRTIVLNIDKIQKVSTLVNGRIMAVLDNGEKTIITRVYANDFKKKLRR